MRKSSHLAKSPLSNLRARILFKVLFVLLVLHFILVYTFPSWLGIYRVISSGQGVDPSVSTHQRIIEEDGKRYLWGGTEKNQHFNITEFRLNPNQLHYGIGRERFPALIEPEFIPAEEADQWPWLDDYQRVLAVKIGGEVKVYPIELLIRHEVVNDVIGGRPIFAAYCILADLGAVYDRHIGGHVLTFALSGYTYATRNIWGGRDAFVLWDRETESLWWPPIGRAVSGPYIDIPMKILEKNLWAQTTWGKIKNKYSEVKVLKPGQDFERPANWQRLPVPSQESIPEKLQKAYETMDGVSRISDAMLSDLKLNKQGRTESYFKIIGIILGAENVKLRNKADACFLAFSNRRNNVFEGNVIYKKGEKLAVNDQLIRVDISSGVAITQGINDVEFSNWSGIGGSIEEYQKKFDYTIRQKVGTVRNFITYRFSGFEEGALIFFNYENDVDRYDAEIVRDLVVHFSSLYSISVKQKENQILQYTVMRKLADLAETRDLETGSHLFRIQPYQL